MEKIRNKEEILSHGNVESRKVVLGITEKVLQKLDARERIKSIMSLDGDILKIGVKSRDLSKKKNVYLFGAGKACNHMVMAVDEILGVGLGVKFQKNGCPRSGERIDKLNFLMRVADLHEGCVMADISDIVKF